MSDIRFVRRNIRAISLLGLWEYGDFKNKFVKNLFYIYGKAVYFYFVLFNLTEFIEMYNIGNNILLLMGNAAVSLLYAVTLLKSYTLHFRKDRVENLLEVVRKSEEKTAYRNIAERQLYEESVEQNFFVSKLFWYVCGSTISMFYVARPAEYYLLGPQEIHGFKVPFVFR